MTHILILYYLLVSVCINKLDISKNLYLYTEFSWVIMSEGFLFLLGVNAMVKITPKDIVNTKNKMNTN